MLWGSSQGITAQQAMYQKWSWMGNPATKTHTGKNWSWCTGSPTALFTSKLLQPAALNTRGHSMRFLVPYCRIDVYRCSFFPLGYVFGTSCQGPSSQRQPWRPSREGWLVTFSQQRNVFIRFFIVLTVPQTHLVNTVWWCSRESRALIGRRIEHLLSEAMKARFSSFT